jgi:GNAT superfamily N-acetyltransferase
MTTTSFTLRELTGIPEMLQHIEIIKLLGPSLTEDIYKNQLAEMQRLGYGQVAVFDGAICVGISGFWINTKLYSGKYLEMDNVIVLPEYRSKGIGKLLSDWCEQKAKENNCKVLMLDAWIDNEKAHRFYEREGYTKRGFHFLKHL